MKYFIFFFILVAVGILGCQPAPAPATFANLPPNPGKSFLDQMRQKYNGDASKLTPEERTQLDQITRGHTEVAMKIPGKQ